MTKNAQIDAFEVYSSIVVGNNAIGIAKLFVSPLGQGIVRLGDVPETLFSAHTPFTTNMTRSSFLGTAVGDFAVRNMRFDFVGASIFHINQLLDVAVCRLKVAGKTVAEGGLRDFPQWFHIPILISKLDVIGMEIEVTQKITSISPFLLRAVLSGDRLWAFE